MRLSRQNEPKHPYDPQIETIIGQYANNIFTSNNLALVYGGSLRCMYRIVDKLESAGFAAEAGRKIVDGSGRSSRLMRIDL